MGKQADGDTEERGVVELRCNRRGSLWHLKPPFSIPISQSFNRSASRISMAQIVAAPVNGSSSLWSRTSGSGAIKKSLKPSAIPSKFYGQEKETKRRSNGRPRSLISAVGSRMSTVLTGSSDDVVKVSLVCC